MQEEAKKKRRTPKQAKNNTEKSKLDAPVKLKLLFTIVDRSKGDFYLSALEGYDVNMQTVIYGNGTAPTEALNLLGLNDAKKAIIISCVKENKVKEIMAAYEDKYFKTKNGKGIAFTIPVSSVIGVMVYKFLVNLTEGKAE